VCADRFEDLRVWQAARRQCDDIGLLLKRPEFRRDLELSKQLNAAGISVMSNISEGFLRHRDKEFLQFLRIAAGSNGEVRSCFYVAKGRDYVTVEEGEQLIEGSNAIGRMIRRLQNSLSP
jgi:four helix bundle protein